MFIIFFLGKLSDKIFLRILNLIFFNNFFLKNLLKKLILGYEKYLIYVLIGILRIIDDDDIVF